MAIEKVKEYLKQYHAEERIKEFPTSSATVELAAQALGCEKERIAKSISFLVNEEPVLVVTAGDCKIDNAKFREQFHCKAKMISPDQVENYIGHSVGGVCPFAVKENVKIYLDNSLRRFSTIFPACGSSNSAIELSIEELENYSNALTWVDVCKDMSERKESNEEN